MRFFFIIEKYANHISNIFKHFASGSVTRGSESTHATERNFWKDEVFDSPSFCQLTFASGAVWTCSGYGDFHLFKSMGSKYETVVLELLEYFMIEPLVYKFKKDSAWASRIATCCQHGLTIPIIDFYCCQKAENPHSQISNCSITDIYQNTHYKEGYECRYCSGCKNCPLKVHIESFQYLSHYSSRCNN